ncbi:uncharacterized protein LOC119396271 [Rhipicephalus sanguineus]|uniref:uncharacterized protein LOC119396271 n=1 Tax=Rhipicephalus sanguineus TaxID=34632 RepID=UPI0020C275FC|nr:uncharacterized protein LOC119396271 [Rhipicephalus sanguineus]
MWLPMLFVLVALAEAQKGRSPISAHGVQYVSDQPENPYRVVYDDDPRYALHGGQSTKPGDGRTVRYHAFQAEEQRSYLHSRRVPTTTVSLHAGSKQALSGAATSKNNQHTSIQQQGAPGVGVGDQSQLVYPQGSLPGYAIPQEYLQQGVSGGASAEYLRAGAVYAPTSDIAQYSNALQNYAQQLGYPAAYAQNQGYPSGSSAGEPTQYVQQPYYVPYYPGSSYSGAGAPTHGVADQTGGAVHVPATVPQGVDYTTGSAGPPPGQNGFVYPPRYSPESSKPATPGYVGADTGTSPKVGTDLSVPSDHYGKGNGPAQVVPTGAGQGVYSYPYGYPVAYVPYRYPVQPTAQAPPTHHTANPAQPPYSAPAPAYTAYAQPQVPSGPIQAYYSQQNAYANQAPVQTSQEQFTFGGPPRTIYSLPGPITSTRPSPAALHHAKHHSLPAAATTAAPRYGKSFVDIGYTAASIYGTPMYSKASPNPFLSKYVNGPGPLLP